MGRWSIGLIWFMIIYPDIISIFETKSPLYLEKLKSLQIMNRWYLCIPLDTKHYTSLHLWDSNRKFNGSQNLRRIQGNDFYSIQHCYTYLWIYRPRKCNFLIKNMSKKVLRKIYGRKKSFIFLKPKGDIGPCSHIFFVISLYGVRRSRRFKFQTVKFIIDS